MAVSPGLLAGLVSNDVVDIEMINFLREKNAAFVNL